MKDEIKSQALSMQELRKRVNLTQRAISVELDISVDTLRQWESGRTIPRVEIFKIEKLCKLYQCTIDELGEAVRLARLSYFQKQEAKNLQEA